ncbi:hypothetical protein HS962_17240 [Pantoea sp. BIGb0393]|uniref:Uncharacterized protein n=1 Tax=Pantoea nemavictus TaxID=2726955 RepID=A0ABU8PW37_9GAMM|nr:MULTISPECIES: hypothetical protein [Pantoea]MBA0037946.1 hypothetical protein [Pantoea nemavictus]
MNKLLSLAKVALLYVGEQWNNAGVSALERFRQEKERNKSFCRIERTRSNGVRRNVKSGT